MFMGVSGLELVQSGFLLTYIYLTQIYNNSILPPGGNGGQEYILACYLGLGRVVWIRNVAYTILKVRT